MYLIIYILYVFNYYILCVFLYFKKNLTLQCKFLQFVKKPKNGKNVNESDHGGPVCEMLNALIYFGHRRP